MASGVTQWVNVTPRKKPRPERLSERLPFESDDRIDPRLVTVHAGVPLGIERFRRVGAAQVVKEQVRLKQRPRGVPPAPWVETLNLQDRPMVLASLYEAGTVVRIVHSLWTGT